MAVAQPGWSADGTWYWDGVKWNDALSQDGKWRYDGAAWQPFLGQRIPMPPPLSPPQPLAGATPDGAQMPSWIAASEIQRLESEKIQRRLAEMTPATPVPPELDWRQVGERMQYSDYSHSSGYAFWRVGATSVVIYLLLFWLCGVFSVIYVWMTAWRTSSKIICTCISLALLFVYLLIVVARSYVPQPPV
jgi:hypothetical protein